jgi:hypothetical protein
MVISQCEGQSLELPPQIDGTQVLSPCPKLGPLPVLKKIGIYLPSAIVDLRYQPIPLRSAQGLETSSH